MCRRDFKLATECRSAFEIGLAYSLADESLLVGLGQVGRNLAGAFASLQFLGKELLGGAEVIGVFGGLLVEGELELGVTLVLDGSTFERTADLTN